MSSQIYGRGGDNEHVEDTDVSYESSIAETSLAKSEAKKQVINYDWINRIKEDAFPPEHLQLIRVFERVADRPY